MEVKISAEEMKKRQELLVKKTSGIKWVSEIEKENPMEEKINGFPKKVLDNLHSYPVLEKYPANFHIVDVKTFQDGRIELQGIVRNGKEKTKEYQAFGISIPSDMELFELEKKQFKEGKLKEIAERTLKLHQKEDYWNDLESKIKSGVIKKNNH